MSESITITVPKIPPSQNQLMRMHWAKRKREQIYWQEWLCAGMSDAEKDGQGELVRAIRSSVLAQKRIRMTITVHHSRKDDRDNLWARAKLICDAANYKRGAGMIWDDNEKHLELTVKQEKTTRKDAHTVIEVALDDPLL